MDLPMPKRVKMQGALAPAEISELQWPAIPPNGSNDSSLGLAPEGSSFGRARSLDRYGQDVEADDPPSKPRNFDQVRFGDYVIQTWFYSPYPMATPSTSTLPPPATIPPLAQSSSSSYIPIAPAPSQSNGIKKGRFNGNQHTAARKRREDALERVRSEMGPIGDEPGNAEEPDISSATELVPLTPKVPGRSGSKVFTVNGDSPGAEAPNGAQVPATRSLWVCDRCFKYMRELKHYRGHMTKCTLNQPPGRKVYQKGTYCIWEVDGSKNKLYCQNLSLFGKLFIDHKTIFFDVDGFLFYILTEAMPKRDHVMAYFSKERVSYDDYNLACIVTFPMFQGQGFGRLLTELSYYLTIGEASPGTPERPLSELGAKGYEGFWVRTLLRTLLSLVLYEECATDGRSDSEQADADDDVDIEHGDERARLRSVWARKRADGTFVTLKDFASSDGQLPDVFPSRDLSLTEVSVAAHLREDDVVFALSRTGLDQLKRSSGSADDGDEDHHMDSDELAKDTDDDEGTFANEWRGVELVISLEAVLRACEHWKLRGKGVLDPSCCSI